MLAIALLREVNALAKIQQQIYSAQKAEAIYATVHRQKHWGRGCFFISPQKLVILAQIQAYMWIEENNQLKKTFVFQDFSEAFAFMTRVAFLAEKAQHHPNWYNVYNRVEIALCTHDAGNVVTDKDRKLAEKIDKLLVK